MKNKKDIQMKISEKSKEDIEGIINNKKIRGEG